MSEKTITLLLVEDHKIVRKGIKALVELEKDIKILDESETGADAFTQYCHLKPTVTIMDIALPKQNGLETSKQILQFDPHAKILILSAHADDGYVEYAHHIGVSGFVVKQCSPEFLVNSIRKVAAGEKAYSESVMARMIRLGSIQTSRSGAQKKKRMILSNREIQILQLIAEGSANKQVAAELNISIKTVEKHRQNLMKKLCIHDTAGLTRYAIAEGIIECSIQKTFF